MDGFQVQQSGRRLRISVEEWAGIAREEDSRRMSVSRHDRVYTE